MKKILILNGAPRKNGNTASLINAFVSGAKEVGNEVREDYIQGMEVKHCLGCDSCMNTHKGCVQNDEGMKKIYEDLIWCDVVVFASSIHFGYFTSQMKAVIDRMWAWFNLPENAGIKKETALIMTSRGEGYESALKQYGIYALFGWKDLGHILGKGKEDEARKLGELIK